MKTRSSSNWSKNLKRSRWILYSLILLSLIASDSLSAQEIKGTSIRGKLTNPRVAKLPIDLRQLKPRLIQEVKLPDIQAPAAILSMTREQRKSWFNDYRESDAGKKILAERKRLLENRKQVDIEIDSDGTFDLANIVPGDYKIIGQTAKQYDQQKYRFAISYNFKVADQFEVNLGNIPILVRRVVQVGESFPQFELPSFDDHDKKITNKDLHGKFSLIFFWGLDSEHSSLELESVVALQKKLAKESTNVLFLGVCLDKKKEVDSNFLSYRKLELEAWGGEAWKDGIEGKALEQFGVTSLPYFCLINPKGHVVANDELCKQLLQKPNINLEMIIRKALDGTDLKKFGEEFETSHN